MAVPRKRKSNRRRKNQRAHDNLTVTNSAACPNCGAAKLPHRVCRACGNYNGRTIIEVAAE
jgi:large subunit ribosomal protein L32